MTLDARLLQSLFIAGTDTGVGKTWVTTRLLSAWVAAGYRAAGMKPVAAGAEWFPEGLRNEDAVALAAAGNVGLAYEVLNPFCFPRATSPHLAARDGRVVINMETIIAKYRLIDADSDLIAVEGAGGWWAPLGDPEPAAPGSGPTMADVAVALGLPVLLVVGIRLGCLNHALLTADAVERSGLTLAGWVANAIDSQFADGREYVESLERRLQAPRLEIPDWTTGPTHSL
jgi:dethiobiotin synthetase